MLGVDRLISAATRICRDNPSCWNCLELAAWDDSWPSCMSSVALIWAGFVIAFISLTRLAFLRIWRSFPYLFHAMKLNFCYQVVRYQHWRSLIRITLSCVNIGTFHQSRYKLRNNSLSSYQLSYLRKIWWYLIGFNKNILQVDITWIIFSIQSFHILILNIFNLELFLSCRGCLSS